MSSPVHSVSPVLPRPLRLPGARLALLVCASLCHLSTAQAVDKVWNDSSTDFNLAGSWTGGLPGTGDAAVFPLDAGISFQPLLGANATIQQLRFGLNPTETAASGYTLSGAAGAELTLTSSGGITATDAALVGNHTSGTNTISAGLRLTGGTSSIFQAPGGVLALTGALTRTTAATLAIRGGGEVRVEGAFSATALAANIEGISIFDSTLRFKGTSYSAPAHSNGISLTGSSRLIWDSSVDINTFNRIGNRDTVGNKMIVLNQNFSKAAATSADAFFFVNAGGVTTGSFGFSAFGVTDRTVTFTGFTWDTSNGSSGGALKSATFKLNTDSLADAKITLTTGLSIARTGVTRTIEVGDVAGKEVDAEISGAITGTDPTTPVATTLQKTGAGTLLLSATGNTFSDNYSVDAGTLLVSGTISAANSGIFVNGGLTAGTLGGAGTVSAVTVRGGAAAGALGGDLAPGNTAAATGTLNTRGLSLEAGANGGANATLSLHLSATGYDQVNVTGGISLAGELKGSLLNGFTPAPDSLFFILLNDGSDGVTGTFAGLAEGSTVSFGGADFRISYRAESGLTTAASFGNADGNDVALIAVPEPSSAVALLGGIALLLAVRRRGR